MAKSFPIILVAAAALLLGRKRQKKKRENVFVFEEEIVTGGDYEVKSDEVFFTPDLAEFKIGIKYRVNVLDPWLNNRRINGTLATVDHDAGILYATFVDDPTTWIGDITGTDKVGGNIIYGALWLMATAGIGIYASGFASMGASIHAASHAATTTRAMQILGPRAVQIAGALYKKGFGASRIALSLMNFGGAESLANYGVSQAISNLSIGAAGFGLSMSAGILAEIGVSKNYTSDLAASATEAAADFMMSHSATIAGERVPIALLPSSSDYPAVQDFNKWLIKYIIRFQKMHFQ